MQTMDVPVIGLCGGIGSGKSAVARVLEDLGCVVTRSDADARAVLQESDVRDTLVDWWGERVLDADGRVDRAAVASIVFADPDERRRLESLVHPRVEARRRATWAAAQATRKGAIPAFVIDAPLLFEADLARLCDSIIFVDTDLETRMARVREHRGWDEEELNRREKNQWPLESKRDKSDHVVVNNADFDALERLVSAVFTRIVNDFSRSHPDPGSPLESP